MTDTAETHRDRIIDLADEALNTSTAAVLVDYQAVVALVSRVAAPGNHVDEAIDLLTERRDEANVIAQRELEQLTQDEQDEFKLAIARYVARAMILSADMLARSGNLLRMPDCYALPPDVIAATAAMLVTSGLINQAGELLIETEDAGDAPDS
jgi:hypothetical protein